MTDVLLDRNFRVPRSKIALGSHYDFYIRTIAKLGFENYSTSQIGKKILVNKMKENNGDIEKVKQIIQKLKIEILEKEDKILHQFDKTP